jgi:threonine/homoserine/homoserine lactone efflux protein
METQTWLIYLMLVIVATSTPGPAVLFIMSNATLHGWQKALFIAFGNIIGLLFLGTVAVTGLGAILQTSEYIFMPFSSNINAHTLFE